MNNKQISPYKIILPPAAIAMGLIALTQESWESSPTERQHTPEVVVKNTHNDAALTSEESNSPRQTAKTITEGFPVEANPLEQAFAAARQALRQMKESDGPTKDDIGSTSFGQFPGKQVIMNISKDGEISLRPGEGEADWGFTMSGDVSNPVGYETLRAQPGIFNLFGVRLFQAAVASDSFETISGTTLTDSNNNFSSVLSADTSYVIELEGELNDGKLLDVLSVSGSTLTIAEPLAAETDVPYTIRPVMHLSDLVNPSNYPDFVTVPDFNPDNGDLILVPSGAEEFTQYYYSSFPGHEGFFNAATGTPEDPAMNYLDAFFILRRGQTELPLIVAGSVKLTNTLLPVSNTFNYFSSTYPAGATLKESNLETSLQHGTATTADLVLMQDPVSGEFSQYFYSDGSPPLTQGWRKVGEGDTNQELVTFDLNSGFVIQRRAASPYEALLTPPDFYSTL